MEARVLERGETTTPDAPHRKDGVTPVERKSLEDLLLGRGRVSARARTVDDDRRATHQ